MSSGPTPATTSTAAGTQQLVTLRIWRTDDKGSGRFEDYQTPATEGMVVLDAVHAVQAKQANDLAARANKDWAAADAVRDGLTRLGFVIEDTQQGARVIYKP